MNQRVPIRWVSLALLFSLLIAALATPGAVRLQAATATPTNTPFVREFVVLLANIPRVGTLDAAALVRTALNATNFKDYRVTVTPLPGAITTQKQAVDAGKANPRAVAVIWGQTPQGGRPAIFFELFRRVEYDSFIPPLRREVTMSGFLEYPRSVRLPLDAKFDAATLTAFIQTQTYLAVADYGRAATVYEKSRAALEIISALSGDKEIEEIYDFTEAFLNGILGNRRAAADTFETLSKNEGGLLRTLAGANLGALLISAGAVSDALTTLDAAVKVDETVVHALHMRGVAQYLDEQEDAALDDFDAALKLDEKNAFLLNNRGWLSYRAGQTEEAFNDVSAAIAVDPRFTEAYISLAVIYRSAGAVLQAISTISKAVDLDPTYATPLAIRGSLLIRAGQFEQAIPDLDKAIALDPRDAVSVDNRGFVYETLGDWDKALIDYTRAIDIDPDSAFNYIDRGRIYLKKGQFDLAIQDLSLGIQLGGRRPSPAAYFYRAQAHQGLKRYVEAVRDYNEYLRLEAEGQFANIAKQSITVIRAQITNTPTITRTSTITRTPLPPSRTPSRTPFPIITVSPITRTVIPTRTLFPSPTRLPTLSENQLIGTLVALTATVQARATKIAGTISALNTANAPQPSSTVVPTTEPSRTSLPASATPIPSNTTRPPSATPIPPTRTAMPSTGTPIPPSRTPVPPSATP